MATISTTVRNYLFVAALLYICNAGRPMVIRLTKINNLNCAAFLLHSILVYSMIFTPRTFLPPGIFHSYLG